MITNVNAKHEIEKQPKNDDRCKSVRQSGYTQWLQKEQQHKDHAADSDNCGSPEIRTNDFDALSVVSNEDI